MNLHQQLDTDSREQLYNYLNTIKRNSIIFIVTHDDKITDKDGHHYYKFI